MKIGEETVTSYDAIAAGDKAKASGAAFEKQINIALHDAGYPLVRGAAKVPESKLDAASLPPILNWRSMPQPFAVVTRHP